MSSEALDTTTKTKVMESRSVMVACDQSGFQLSIVKLNLSNNSIRSMTQLQQM